MPFDHCLSKPAAGPTDGRGRASSAIPTRRRERHPTSGEAKRAPACSRTDCRGVAAEALASAGFVPQPAVTEEKGGAR